MVWPALIAAGAALFGGFQDRKQRQRDAYNNSPQAIRNSFEAAGFNPLLGPLGGANSNANYAPVMGSAIANAGSAFASGIYSEERLKIEQAALQQDRERLDHMLESTILQPSVAGIYGNNGSEEFPNNPSADISSAPLQRPTFESGGYVPVYLPDGSSILMSKRWTDRLKIGAWDAVILEDFEALWGEQSGQIVGAGQAVRSLMSDHGLKGVSKPTPKDQRGGFWQGAKDFVTGEGYWASPPSPTQPTLKLNANPAFGY